MFRIGRASNFPNLTSDNARSGALAGTFVRWNSEDLSCGTQS